MSLFSLTFGAPLILFGLLTLPAIWWLNRLTPPRPLIEPFPPLAILLKIIKTEDTPANSPWWLTLLRVLLAAIIILALAEPVLNRTQDKISENGLLVIVLDNSWSANMDWDKRVATASQLIDQAASLNLPVLLTATTSTYKNPEIGTSESARQVLAALSPQPLRPTYNQLVQSIKAATDDREIGTLALIHAPARFQDTQTTITDTELSTLLALKAETVLTFSSQNPDPVAIKSVLNESDHIAVTLERLRAKDARTYQLAAYDLQSRPILEGSVQFELDEKTAIAKLRGPFELLNDILRVSIDGQSHAAASHLLDDSFKRRRIAIFAGETNDVINPLLTASHYIERASEPFADRIDVDQINLTTDIDRLFEQRPSAIILSDVGILEDKTQRALTDWVENGGTLLRFAGPRLAAAAQNTELLPVTLRQGERQLGGALSWSEPKTLAPFDPSSPFFGIDISDDIKISRQVLAEPSLELSERSWATLTDGTPLVTANRLGTGRIILFHINADTNWSNLPLSGTFSEMLRRLINLSRADFVQTSSAEASLVSANGESGEQMAEQRESAILPPHRLLTAGGLLTNAISDVSPLELDVRTQPIVTAQTVPGLYGTNDGFLAINLMAVHENLEEIEMNLPSIEQPAIENYPLVGEAPKSLRPGLFLLAIFMLMIDALTVLYMSGGLSRLPSLSKRVGQFGAIAFSMALLSIATAQHSPTQASDVKPDDMESIRLLEVTHLAYVITGDQEVDNLSELGLKGLGRYLRTRTAIEPGPPQAVDIETDELSFYPLIYWPMSERAQLPSREAIARLDTYMRDGGTVLFDTRDENEALGGAGRTTPHTLKLREILFGLDIPPLEPVPPDHVLTKAFYLLDQFPGRFAGGELWIEALAPDRDKQDLPVYSADGVSPIIITSNDFAGAWAMDEDLRPILPVSSRNERQRTLAFRTGVNIMMYMLTGNYKADQVHVPALLERLGQ